VPDAVETTLTTYTALNNATISDVLCSGTDYARFNVYVNTVLKLVMRSGPARNVNFPLQFALQLTAADVLDIKVIHYNTGIFSDFDATILGVDV
jgi:hypothetical protein